MAALAGLLLAVTQSQAEDVGLRLPKIDVPGVIQITRMVQPDQPLLTGGRIEEEISPDERHFFVITRRQDLQTNQNVYQLVLFETASLLIEGSGLPMRGRSLVDAQSSSNFVFEHAIRSAKWLDNSTIAFLGEFEDQPAQVYTVDIATGRLTQLTDHASPVLAFDYQVKSDVVVYVAREPVDVSHMEHASFVAGNASLVQLLFPEDLSKQRLFYRYYRSFVGQPHSIRPLGGTFSLNNLPPTMYLSPNARWVVVRRPPQAFADSVRLANTYPPLLADVSSYFVTQEDPNSLFTEETSMWLMQVEIYNVATAEKAPWFDVPDGTVGREWPYAHWMADGESVLIANTYLPLQGISESERRRRTVTPTLIEYCPSTGRFKKIADMAGGRGAFQGLYASDARPDEVLLKEKGTLSVFRRDAGAWRRQAKSASSPASSGIRGRLRIVQSANAAPDVAFEGSTGRDINVTDFNPQLRDWDIGRAQPYRWKDEAGRAWRGGLLLPTDFDQRHRYPLVIQLGGFSEDEFYIDGARQISSAMAGRAYLKEGMIVLAEAGGYLKTGDSRDELLIHAQGIKAAIEALAKDGMIDPDRVGLVGFSGRGAMVQHIMTFGDVKIRAATVADSATNSLFTATAHMYGHPKPGPVIMERRLGASPWGSAAERWAQRDPSLHTDCIEAAVRYELYNLYPFPDWVSYALLRRQYKPVEFVIFPRGIHQLRRPQERFDSLQGNVDWFRFWLKDEEDPAPSKAAQYQRWRAMKAQAPQVRRDASCTLVD